MLTSLFLLLLTSIINANTVEESDKEQFIRITDSQPRYKVHYLPKNDIRVDGNINDKSWERCEVIKNLPCPWDPMANGTGQFRACYDESFFYFSFNVKDSIGLYQDEKNELSVANGDRVELFFSADSLMNNYYCMEIAPNGNMLDYQASYHRNFNNNWNIQGTKIIAKPNANGYMVEGKIPVGFLKKLKNSKGSLKGSVIPAGVFRARKKNVADPEAFIWYSWVDPHVIVPDFHIPSALGNFEF
ncbi:MAG: hypothetical protein JWQ09_17 [Segetibacter sp.]|nr:hypothetical protein [Segetibacter sp.]